MSRKILIFFILLIIIMCIAIGLNHIKEIKTLTNNINGTLYYNEYSNGSEAYSLDFSTNKKEKVIINNGYEILDYLIVSDGYCCIAREKQYDDKYKTFYLQHNINNTDKKIAIPYTSGKLSLIDNGAFFFSDYYTTANSFTLSYLNFSSDSISDIKSNIVDYCIANNILYYIKDSNLIEFNFTTNKENLISKNCSQIISDRNNLVFIKSDDGIYKYNSNTKFLKKFSIKNNYKLIAVINDENIIISKQFDTKGSDEIEYNVFKNKPKQKYYILSNDKLIYLKELYGCSIENGNYYNKELEK